MTYNIPVNRLIKYLAIKILKIKKDHILEVKAVYNCNTYMYTSVYDTGYDENCSKQEARTNLFEDV